MADIDYQVVVHVFHKGVPIDSTVIDDEDHWWAMNRLGVWADECLEKDL